jgi:transcriptional regulator with XRE-family HTH domain
MESQSFAQNLKLLCSFEKSVSEICRAVGINRQQFSKYLSGANHPSAHNLRRICEHFQVQQSDLHLPPSEFSDRMQFHLSDPGRAKLSQPNRMLARVFPGDLRALRRYLGYYMTYYHTQSWSGYVLRTLTSVYEQDGMVLTKTIDRVRDPVDGTLFLSKYDGYVSLLGNRIFVVEFQSLAQDAIVETVLLPESRSELSSLQGATIGVSSKRRAPYFSKVVWKFLGRTIDHRKALGSIGLLSINSPILDPAVLQVLGEPPMPE